MMDRIRCNFNLINKDTKYTQEAHTFVPSRIVFLFNSKMQNRVTVLVKLAGLDNGDLESEPDMKNTVADN